MKQYKSVYWANKRIASLVAKYESRIRLYEGILNNDEVNAVNNQQAINDFIEAFDPIMNVFSYSFDFHVLLMSPKALKEAIKRGFGL